MGNELERIAISLERIAQALDRSTPRARLDEGERLLAPMLKEESRQLAPVGTRIRKTILMCGIRTIEELEEYDTAINLLESRNFGATSYAVLSEWAATHGITMPHMGNQ